MSDLKSLTDQELEARFFSAFAALKPEQAKAITGLLKVTCSQPPSTPEQSLEPRAAPVRASERE